MSDSDNETKAIGAIAGIVAGLQEDQRGRVIRYIVERFNIVGASRSTKMPAGGSQMESQIDTPAEFEDFASLVDARHVVRLDNSPERRNDLVQRLKVAGCNPKTDGTDWIRTGNFERFT
jgi:hypothetical protein